MAVPVAGGALLVALLLYAHSRRFFSRFSNGVFLSAAATIMTVALIAAAVIGTWGYEAARRLMRIELSVSLDSIASIIQQQIDLEVVRVVDRLAGLSAAAAPALEPGGDLKDLTSSLRAIQSFNPHYLEIDLIDRADGSSLPARSMPLSGPCRIGSRRRSTWRARHSSPSRGARRHTSGRWCYVGVPVKDPSGAVVGALGTVFDLQAVFEEVINAAKFNESGYAVVVGANGRILAHPDASRIDQDISHYPAVIEAQRRVSGETVAANPGGEQRRFFFRQIRNPQTVDAKPWILLTEINESEALRPLVQLRDELAAGVGVIIVISPDHRVERRPVARPADSRARRHGARRRDGRFRRGPHGWTGWTRSRVSAGLWTA